MTMSEAQTRSELIDHQLARAGWNVNEPTQVIAELGILTVLPEGLAEPLTPYAGHQFSDYVLLGKDGKPLAVIGAKKTSSDAAVGREQAKQYCYNIGVFQGSSGGVSLPGHWTVPCHTCDLRPKYRPKNGAMLCRAY